MRRILTNKRNDTLLTRQEFEQARDYAIKLGMPFGHIFRRESMNTSWGVVFGQEMLNIAPDVLPCKRIEGRTLPVNSYLSWRAAIAHEVVGHRAAYMAGRTQENDILEEVQASLRAAKLAEGLTKAD